MFALPLDMNMSSFFYIACSFSCDLSNLAVFKSFFSLFIVFMHLSLLVFSDFSRQLSLCLRVSYVFSIFTAFICLFISLCGLLLPFLSPFITIPHYLLFYVFPSSLFFHPALPFLCLSACRCRMCAATFFSKSDMQIHSKSHTEAKPHKCPHCAKSFANSSYLAQHIRIHSGAKPYTCSYCQKSFRQLSHLQQHTRYCRRPFVTILVPHSLSS